MTFVCVCVCVCVSYNVMYSFLVQFAAEMAHFLADSIEMALLIGCTYVLDCTYVLVTYVRCVCECVCVWCIVYTFMSSTTFTQKLVDMLTI